MTSPAVPGSRTFLCEFTYGGTVWRVYEALDMLGGDLAFVASDGRMRLLGKNAEAAFEETSQRHLGLSLNDIGLAGRDLLAEALLDGGDPNPDRVRIAAPPQGSATPPPGAQAAGRPRWDTFVGTKECFDTMPVFPAGNTRTFRPVHTFPELAGLQAGMRYDGLVGGWMPAVRKVFPVGNETWIEMLIFGDVEARDRFIVQTWHRTVRVEKGKIVKVSYGYSYPQFPPRRTEPPAEAFYRALLVFADYWARLLEDVSPAELPQPAYFQMVRHAFAKELMVRPGGVYPKYGAVDRDYYGSEYDGFQDIFTSSLYANLEWNRIEMARQVVDNYFTEFVDSRGMVNMRGPETAQFGLTLSLLAKYFYYARDAELLLKHRPKIEATADLLRELHDESLRLPPEDPGHGLIHGWSESDSCLHPDPSVWWKPYFANSAWAARGWKDIAAVWSELGRRRGDRGMQELAAEWEKRSRQIAEATVQSMRQNVRMDLDPPYIGPLPGTKLTFRESLEQERPSPQQWPHRPYAELLQADVLPPELANLVVNCMRAYGATTLGVVANVGRARPGARAILGFISYGYALALLRLERVEEFLLFLYSHRFHVHTRGSWTAGEVCGINGGTALFCIPAQLTIPMLVKWMLVLEDSDADRLYLGRGIPREWVGSGLPVSISKAATRWGPVSFLLQSTPASRRVVAKVTLDRVGAPQELNVKLRLPAGANLRALRVNGSPVAVGGVHQDTAAFRTDNQREFEIVGEW